MAPFNDVISKLYHFGEVLYKYPQTCLTQPNKKKHLIITGKNGSGKTSLLESIKKYFEALSDECLSLKSDSEQRSKSSYKRQREKTGIALTFNQAEGELQRNYREGNCLLAYFAATRSMSIEIPKYVPKVEFKESYPIEENIGDMFLNYLVYLKTQQSFARNENEMDEVERIENWFKRLEGAFWTLFEDESIRLQFDYKNLNFKIHQEGREPYGFDVLSDGYASVLDIVINLILRMEKKNRQAYDVGGIVVIDEIENHLHIELQKKILPFLTEFFPNIQFIVSTHSPFVINSIDDVVIYDLEKKQRVEDLSGIAYEGIVEGYFDINQYSEKIKNKLERYQYLVEKKDASEADKEEAYELRR